MRNSKSSTNLRWTLSSVVILVLVFAFHEKAWSQRPNRGGGDRPRSTRDDPTSLINALRNKEIAEKIGLTPEQQTQFEEIRSAASRSYRGMSSVEFQAAKKANEEKVLGLLTDEQKSTWQKHVDEILSARPAEEANKAAPAETGGAVRAENEQPSPKSNVPDNGPPAGAKTVVSFGRKRT